MQKDQSRGNVSVFNFDPVEQVRLWQQRGPEETVLALQKQRSVYTIWLKLEHTTAAERRTAQGKIDMITKVIDGVLP